MHKSQSKSKNYSICLTTYFDKGFEEIGSLCLESLKKYAKKYGFDIKLYNDFKSNRPAPWNKIKIVEKILNDKKRYDFVFWIDADALFVNFDEDIRLEIEPENDLYLVKHQINESKIPNTGVFLLRNSDWSKEFLKEVWDKKEYIHHNWWENAAINELLGFVIEKNSFKQFIHFWLYKLKLKNLIIKIIKKLNLVNFSSKIVNKNKTLSQIENKKTKENLKKTKWLEKKWNSIPRNSSINPIIKHYPAMQQEERIREMIKDSSN